MELNRYDLIFILVCVGVGAYQGWGILQAKKGIRYEGQQPGKTGGLVLGAIAVVLCALKKGDLQHTWPVFAALALLLAVYACTKVGVGADGVYRYSRRYSFDQIKYYELDTHQPSRPILRVGTGLKEVGMIYTDEAERTAVIRLLESHGAKEVAIYRREEGQRVAEYTEKRQAKKQARKKK